MTVRNDILCRGMLAARGSRPVGQAVRYVVAGGLAFAVDFLLLKLLTDGLGWYYLWSAVTGYAAGLAITYTLSVKWVFSRRRMSNRGAEFAVFALIGIAGLALTSLFMWVFTSLAGIHYLVSKMITTFLVTAWNFIAKKKILF